MQSQTAISKKRKFVADGVFYSELNEFLQRTLAEDGFSGAEVQSLFAPKTVFNLRCKRSVVSERSALSKYALM